MSRLIHKRIFRITFILAIGIISALSAQLIQYKPITKHIHIRNFRYGKDPSVIRCNRGDSLLLTFSTDDTGHSFFLEEFDMDAKVSPASKKVSVFKTSTPTHEPLITDTVKVEANYPSLYKYFFSKSYYRCHVWCGPMHAFEQGKLVIWPNTLLIFALGCIVGIFMIWIWTFSTSTKSIGKDQNKRIDLFKKIPTLGKLLTSRWVQIILILLALLMMYVAIITSVFGTKVSGRNLGVLLMWAIWLFVLVAILTPFFGRAWCSICPLPFFGDWLQRSSLFSPLRGKRDGYNNDYNGFFLKWPRQLSGNWLRLVFFLFLSTFSVTLVATPRISGLAILALILIPTLMSLIWRHRAFCNYLCPVSVFISPFSGLSPIAIGPKSQAKCDVCQQNFCEKGSAKGWACPYGLNVGKMDETVDCGLCLECLRSCAFKNVTMIKRPFGYVQPVRNSSEALLSIAIFTMSVVYSLVYLGVWPTLRDYVNILDKENWDLFGIYSSVIWLLVLAIIPSLLLLLAYLGRRWAKSKAEIRSIFYAYTSFLIPLGMMFWIGFVVPMLFVNVTFIAQSASDPFGWGWDFFGTSNIPWHQFMPEYIPWIQAILALSGFNLCMRNIRKWTSEVEEKAAVLKLALPITLFLFAISVFMIFFYTN